MSVRNAAEADSQTVEMRRIAAVPGQCRPREHEVVPAWPRNCERELEAKNAENARLREDLEEEPERRLNQVVQVVGTIAGLAALL
jgi:hypothetical protein